MPQIIGRRKRKGPVHTVINAESLASPALTALGKMPAIKLMPDHVGRGGRHHDLDKAAQNLRELADIGFPPGRVMLW